MGPTAQDSMGGFQSTRFPKPIPPLLQGQLLLGASLTNPSLRLSFDNQESRTICAQDGTWQKVGAHQIPAEKISDSLPSPYGILASLNHNLLRTWTSLYSKRKNRETDPWNDKNNLRGLLVNTIPALEPCLQAQQAAPGYCSYIFSAR